MPESRTCVHATFGPPLNLNRYATEFVSLLAQNLDLIFLHGAFIFEDVGEFRRCPAACTTAYTCLRWHDCHGEFDQQLLQ